ncbi:hypothetical protein [Mucilaginibacter pedocola]|uniref:Uncharacterized protein n=1 Tax=Mucilaginibacter pedocola TaxID=1792845 RepID=A0A1S9PHD6_9SPHI|nr:hypothetical protein [Mucilaginibacter pedocola]OOQ60370.1 hypothetical protein BC343_25445 [Mucilaginibacter pedocola]
MKESAQKNEPLSGPDAEIRWLKTKYEEFARQQAFILAWLRKNHPEVFKEMIKASEENDLEYIRRSVKEFSDKLSQHFE